MVLSVVQLISPSGSQNTHAFCSLRKVQLAGNLHTLQNVLIYCLFDSSSAQTHSLLYICAHQYLIVLHLPSPRELQWQELFPAKADVCLRQTLFSKYQHHMLTKDHISS